MTEEEYRRAPVSWDEIESIRAGDPPDQMQGASNKPGSVTVQSPCRRAALPDPTRAMQATLRLWSKVRAGILAAPQPEGTYILQRIKDDLERLTAD